MEPTTASQNTSILDKYLNEEWKKTCKVVLGQEVGDIERYAKYLYEWIEPVKVERSTISGKGIAICGERKEGTRFISADEIQLYEKQVENKKLDINQVKDLDSIIEAVREKIYYAGNIHLGNTSYADSSNMLIDSVFVNKSQNVFYSRYVHCCDFVRYSDHIFGSTYISKTKFAIKNYETYEDVRLLETIRTYYSSDCFYTSNLENCQNCLFCFNLRNKRNCIGNLQLPQDRFIALKEKLLEDIRQTLISDRKLPSIIEIIRGGSNA